MPLKRPPRLPLSAFDPLSTPAEQTQPASIFDSSSLISKAVVGSQEFHLSTDGSIIALPVNEGAAAVNSFWNELPETRSRIVGARCDLSGANLLDPLLIEGLRELGKKRLSFTFDSNKLEDIFDCITASREGTAEELQTRFIIDNLRSPSTEAQLSNRQSDFTTALFNLALLPDLYIKLSGFLVLLSHNDPTLLQTAFETNEMKELKTRLKISLEPTLESFGESRILFGSDTSWFPMEETKKKWEFEKEIYRSTLVELGVVGEGLDSVFEGTAREAFGL